MVDEIIQKGLLNEYNKLVDEDSILPIKVTPFYMKKIKEEITMDGILVVNKEKLKRK